MEKRPRGGSEGKIWQMELQSQPSWDLVRAAGPRAPPPPRPHPLPSTPPPPAPVGPGRLGWSQPCTVLECLKVCGALHQAIPSYRGKPGLGILHTCTLLLSLPLTIKGEARGHLGLWWESVGGSLLAFVLGLPNLLALHPVLAWLWSVPFPPWSSTETWRCRSRRTPKPLSAGRSVSVAVD